MQLLLFKCLFFTTIGGESYYFDEIFNDLKFSFQCQYDDKDAIGRRYRRQDAIGTPFCVTIDFETMSDHSVTIRERDSLLQERVLIKDLANLISNKIAWQNLFK